jgi:hypothetical protein
MGIRLRVGTPAGLSVLFVLLTGIPLAALGWLGSRLLAQEHALERQQRRDLLENSIALLTHEIELNLSRWEEAAAAGMAGDAAPPPPETLLLVFDARGMVRERGVRLPYFPAIAPDTQLRSPELAAAAALEYRATDLVAAASAYRRLAATT